MLQSYFTLSVLSAGAFICVGHAHADCPFREYGWARTGGSPTFDQARGLAVDDQGNVYTVGSFTGRVDFDPSGQKEAFTSNGEDDLFITGYSADGGYRWTKRIGGPSFDHAFGVATIGGETVFTGTFRERVDFDPGRNKDKQKSNGFSDLLVTRLRSDGTYGSTRSVGGIGDDIGWSVAVDSQSNVIVAGWFEQSVDFDPGPAVDERTSVDRSRDVFVTKLGHDGSYHWTRAFGGPLMDVAFRVAVAPDDAVIITGEFRGSFDFDPSEGEDIHQSAGDSDIFITKFGADGSYQWTHTAGAPEVDVAYAIAVDGQGNVYVTGAFELAVDFDRRGGGDVHVSNGLFDVFVTKRGPDGSYRWTRTFGGTAIESGFGIDVDDSGLLVVGGNYSGTVDFDFTEGVDRRTALGGRDAFLTRMTTNGDYSFTDVFGGPEGNDGVQDLAIAADGSVVACGSFESQNVDFDPTGGLDLHSSNGSFDFFIMKHYCGACEAVERHTVEGGKKKIISTVRALAPGGKVTVECAEVDPPGPPIRKIGGIDNDNAARLVFKRLRGGDYECRITEVKDAAGDVICDAPTGKRRVTVSP